MVDAITETVNSVYIHTCVHTYRNSTISLICWNIIPQRLHDFQIKETFSSSMDLQGTKKMCF